YRAALRAALRAARAGPRRRRPRGDPGPNGRTAGDPRPGGANERPMTPISFPTPPRRILIIKPSAVGDVVHALPVLNLVRRRWPEAHITWLVAPSCAGLVERHPQVDDTIRFERQLFGTGWRSPAAVVQLFR